MIPDLIIAQKKAFEEYVDNLLFERLHSLLRRERCLVQAKDLPWMIIQDKPVISFSSSDYLGLSHDSRLRHYQRQAIEKYGLGSGSSALVSGYQSVHQACEKAFAEFLQADRALLFASGYTANIAVLSTLRFFNKNISLFLDKQSHASLYDGSRLSELNFHRFHHHDYFDLKKKLDKLKTEKPCIVTESVFSMDGSSPDLHALLVLAQAHQGYLMVDEAHALGVIGEQGQGLVVSQGLATKIPMRIYPLGKAFASQGAVVVGSHDWIETLIQFARPYIYSTAVLPALASTWQASIALIQSAFEARQTLKTLIQVFKHCAQSLNLPFLPSDTPIQCLPISQVDKLMLIQQTLFHQGFHVAAIRPPSVPPRSSLLRFSLMSQHTAEQIEKVLHHLAEHYHDDGG